MKSRCITLFVVIGILCAATASSAQQPATRAHSLDEGVWALQFGIGQNLSLGTFAGGVISAKQHRAPGRAVRYGVSLSSDHMGRQDETPSRTDGRFTVMVDFLRYPMLASEPNGDLHLYWGFGPLLGFESRPTSVGAGEHENFNTLSMGVTGTVGAEWFVRQRISLTAEYRSSLRAMYGWIANQSIWQARLGQDSVRFGVSAYIGSGRGGEPVTAGR